MAALRVLSIAVSSGRVGYVCFDGRQLQDWAITTTVSGNLSDLMAFAQELINRLKPDVVVTEKCDRKSRKGRRTRRRITSIVELASHNYVLDVSVPRPRSFPSKYEEATDVVTRYPDLVGYLPKRKRRIFDFEPRNMIIFEAIALAEAVIDGPPETLASALG
ncbi:MAG: hypothetical protein AAGE80_17410 [Pseudomonadota bacterium]